MILGSLLRTFVLDLSLNTFFESLPSANPLLPWQMVSVGETFLQINFRNGKSTQGYFHCKVLEIDAFRTVFEYQFDESMFFQIWDGITKITRCPTQDLMFFNRFVL